MTNTQIVEDNYKLIDDCVYFQMKKYNTPLQFKRDLVQETCLILLEYSNEKLNKIVQDRHLNAFITGILRNQLYSKSSLAYSRYFRPFQSSKDITDYYGVV